MFIKFFKNAFFIKLSFNLGQGPRINPDAGKEANNTIKGKIDLSSILNLATKINITPLSEEKLSNQEKIVQNEIKETVNETRQLSSQLSNEVFMGLNIEKRLSLVSDFNVGDNLINKDINIKFPTKDLEQKVSAGEIMPSDIKIIGKGTELYKRKSNGEFYNVLNGKRLAILTGTTLSVPDQNKAENLVNETLQKRKESISKAGGDFMRTSAKNISQKEKIRIIEKAPENIKRLIMKYFPQNEWGNALLVCYKESHFNPNAIGQNTDKFKSKDFGLFQINNYWHADKLATGNWRNPDDNVRMARAVYDERKRMGKNPWTAWYAAGPGKLRIWT